MSAAGSATVREMMASLEPILWFESQSIHAKQLRVGS
jgi:hypothetical protein